MQRGRPHAGHYVTAAIVYVQQGVWFKLQYAAANSLNAYENKRRFAKGISHRRLRHDQAANYGRIIVTWTCLSDRMLTDHHTRVEITQNVTKPWWTEGRAICRRHEFHARRILPSLSVTVSTSSALHGDFRTKLKINDQTERVSLESESVLQSTRIDLPNAQTHSSSDWETGASRKIDLDLFLQQTASSQRNE